MGRRSTYNDFVLESRKIHGNKYDYSNVEYVNSYTKVCIICPIHGEFWQAPSNHLRGQGCKKCSIEKNKKPLYGVGINDTVDVFEKKDYKIWRDMLERCYCQKRQELQPSYKGCTVCEEWKYFSNFRKWFAENYVEGWHLDKDVLKIGNRVYSPETCCFLPHKLNSILRLPHVNNHCGIYKTKHGKYSSCMRFNGKFKFLGVFETFEEAQNVRNNFWIKKVEYFVNMYKDKLPPHIQDACMDYSKALEMDFTKKY